MTGKKNKFKFLSQSVLLEEQGMPKLNFWIIVIVFAMVVSFVSWSIVMELDQVITVSGSVIGDNNAEGTYAFSVQIPSEEIAVVDEGLRVTINIPGVKTSSPLMGKIERVETVGTTSTSGNVYFEGKVIPDKNSNQYATVESQLHLGMKVNYQVVVGKRSLFEYFLGPVLKTNESAFKEK